MQTMHFRFILLLIGTLISASLHSSLGTIFDSRKITIDFTQTNAAALCDWSPTELYSINKDGLGWDGPTDEDHLRAGKIITKPVGIGLFWNPAEAARVRVEIDPAPLQITSGDGKKYSLPPGRMFARHSPDLVHWSSWQALSSVASSSNRIFDGNLGVPRRERLKYELLLGEYHNLPSLTWSSDEEAAVRWILQKKPKFFEQNLPFIGYVQLLFEGEFVAGYKFRQMRAEISYSLGGLHQPPPTKDIKEQMWKVPWRFTQ